MKKQIVIEIIAFSFFFLFVYTSLSKLYQYDFYYNDLLRSPLLSSVAYPISILIPGSELIVAVLLIPDRTRKYGFIGSLILMALFTLYVGYVLTLTTDRPCTCGGIIRQLSWRNHLIFNLIFLAMGFAGFILEKRTLITTYKN
ncbi:hypothetical protein SAMN05518672_11563 [Chitinophaga sp. CF118]|uniref:MauE/DoxX family redox-associated membrane protein n=1 Tax=Chitinophaga sp. CF118 TaxID=1884367 RepID=UPI0008DF4375|nr:MauE/DoxX family redox-associated membrane protein [Chitinophaga sp. CF118]SFF07132.1 hypothetical protein SAMN05518672_11563 [Chitinophaga sp. CF118]